MIDNRIPKPGDIYRHFKNKLYQIITVAIHSETGEQMVVYQALYGNFKTYVRPLSMFISEVDHLKYPEVVQTYRFQRIELEEDKVDDVSSNISISKEVKADSLVENKPNNEEDMGNSYFENSMKKSSKDRLIDNTASGNIQSILMDFLDAKTYEDKLNIIIGKKKYLNDRIINDMAASIDCSIEEGNLEKRIQDLIYNLSTLSRFEFNRFR